MTVVDMKKITSYEVTSRLLKNAGITIFQSSRGSIEFCSRPGAPELNADPRASPRGGAANLHNAYSAPSSRHFEYEPIASGL